MTMSYPLEQYTYQLFDKNDLGVSLFGVINERTGYQMYTTLALLRKQYPSMIAFAGARYSRSALTISELFHEISGSKKTAQKRLADIFHNYGHASVGDMAMLFAYIEQVPLLSIFHFFYNAPIGAGQERSTRYQNFKKNGLLDLSFFVQSGKPSVQLQKMYTDLEKYALKCYEKYIHFLTYAFTEYYKPGTDKQKLAALQSRVFDTARSFILTGFKNSVAYITSAREWARLIAEMKGTKSMMYETLGEQLEQLFVPPKEVTSQLHFIPEAPDLIRHTEANTTIQENLAKLRRYIEEKTDILATINRVNAFATILPQEVLLLDHFFAPSVVMLAQYMLSLYPDVTMQSACECISSLPENKRKEMSAILFANHTNYVQMNNMGRVGAYTFNLTLTIAEARDFNRHRSFAHFTPLLEYHQNTRSFLKYGFILPLYLSAGDQFKAIRKTFTNDLEKYYLKLERFVFQIDRENIIYDPQLIATLLPLATAIPYTMHGGVKEISYLTTQRVRPGGHINYRDLAYCMAKCAADADPLLECLALPSRPDPFSAEEFFDRS